MSIFRIGEISERLGISTDSIRLYEKKGLIEKPVRGTNGYRLYSESIVPSIKFIINAKAMGFTLKEIKELLDVSYTSDKTCEDVRTIAVNKLEAIEQRLVELNKLKEALRELIDTCDKRRGDTCPFLNILENRANKEDIKNEK